jgi:hypothetical protein
VPSRDLWLAILTVMAALKQAWYEPCAIQIMLSDGFDRRQAAAVDPASAASPDLR